MDNHWLECYYINCFINICIKHFMFINSVDYSTFIEVITFWIGNKAMRIIFVTSFVYWLYLCILCVTQHSFLISNPQLPWKQGTWVVVMVWDWRLDLAWGCCHLGGWGGTWSLKDKQASEVPSIIHIQY